MRAASWHVRFVRGRDGSDGGCFVLSRSEVHAAEATTGTRLCNRWRVPAVCGCVAAVGWRADAWWHRVADRLGGRGAGCGVRGWGRWW